MSFDEIFDLTAGVYFNFYNIYQLAGSVYYFGRLLFQVVRLNKRDRRGRRRGESISICARKLYILEEDESDGCSKKKPFYFTRLLTFFFQKV